MNRLSPESAQLIRAKAAVLLGDPDPARERIAELEKQLSDYRLSQWFYESWVAFLEGRLRVAGIDPMDMWDDPPTTENA